MLVNACCLLVFLMLVNACCWLVFLIPMNTCCLLVFLLLVNTCRLLVLCSQYLSYISYQVLHNISNFIITKAWVCGICSLSNSWCYYRPFLILLAYERGVTLCKGDMCVLLLYRGKVFSIKMKDALDFCRVVILPFSSLRLFMVWLWKFPYTTLNVYTKNLPLLLPFNCN